MELILKLISDLTFVSYGVIGGISLYGFALFFWWWRRIGKATEVYLYVTFLFAAIFVVAGGVIHARYLLLIGQETEYHRLVMAWFWHVRTVPLAVILFLIVARMTQRVVRTLLYEKGFRKCRRKHASALERRDNDKENSIQS
jgi:hypothetical protein